MNIHIVLHEPEIPQNTGNIARTCAVAGCSLHLIHPLGFSTDDKSLRHAGLDYWHLLDVHHYKDTPSFFAEHPDAALFFFTTKAPRIYTEVSYPEETWLMFGKESAGIPEDILFGHADHCVRIPMLPTLRSLNLSNAVAIAAYEVLRQHGFPDMQNTGQLRTHRWEDAP